MTAGVRCALGTDVGGGTGFGMLKEGLQAYLLQRIAADGVLLDPGHLLYLATRAGAEALGLEEEIGDFPAGKTADFVYLRPPPTARSQRWWNRRTKSGSSPGGDCSRWPARRASARFAWKGRWCIAPLPRKSNDHRGFEFAGSRRISSQAIGWVFEHSPWVAERAFEARAVREMSTRCTARWRNKWNERRAGRNWRCCGRIPISGTRAGE